MATDAESVRTRRERRLPLDVEERPEPLTFTRLGLRAFLGIGGVATALFLAILSYSWWKAATDGGDSARLSGLPLGIGLFLLFWSARQLLAVIAAARGDRWWAFVEVVATRPINSRRRSAKSEGPDIATVELRRISDETVVGEVEMPIGWAIRVVEDGVAAVYGRPAIGARVAFGGRFGVYWQAERIRRPGG